MSGIHPGWPDLTDKTLTFVTDNTRVSRGAETGIRADVICTRASILTWESIRLARAWQSEVDEGIKMHSQRAIQLNGLDAHLLHVLCCHYFCCPCAVVKRFTPKGDGALWNSFFFFFSFLLLLLRRRRRRRSSSSSSSVKKLSLFYAQWTLKFKY